MSNIRFWRAVDYFGDLAETTPLLHTWSLGVEEQFYLFYPSVLLALRRWLPRLLVPTLVAGIVLSFALGVVLARTHPTAAFCLIPTRAWELALGALVALGVFPRIASPAARQAAAAAGLAMIIASIVLIDETWSIPAPWSLPSCLGAALLIAYGGGAPTARLLTLAPLRWVGAISYSLYLWHWPIITFYRLTHAMTLQPHGTVLLVCASLGAGAAFYCLVEQPVLRGFRTSERPRTVALAGLAGVVAMALGALGVSLHGADWRPLDPEVRRVANYDDYAGTPAALAQFREGICFATGKSGTFDSRQCLRLRTDKPNVVLLGIATRRNLASAGSALSCAERASGDRIGLRTDAGPRWQCALHQARPLRAWSARQHRPDRRSDPRRAPARQAWPPACFGRCAIFTVAASASPRWGRSSNMKANF